MSIYRFQGFESIFDLTKVYVQMNKLNSFGERAGAQREVADGFLVWFRGVLPMQRLSCVVLTD